MVQYRNEDYAAALATFEQIEVPYVAPNFLPEVKTAFIAMAQSRLGRSDKARVTLEQLDKRMASLQRMFSRRTKEMPKSNPFSQVQGLHKEAEAIVSGSGAR